MHKRLLLIFAHPPGHEESLAEFNACVRHTHSVALQVPADKWVCYPDEIRADDLWAQGGFTKRLQPTGEETPWLHHLLAQALLAGYSAIISIGTKCSSLTLATLDDAYQKLESPNCDLVIGSTQHEDYYILGVKFLTPGLFLEKKSTLSEIFSTVLTTAQQLNMRVTLLP